MGPLRQLLVGVSLVASPPAWAETVADWRPYIAEASTRCGIPVTWIERVIRAESGGQTMLYGRPIRSPAGAMGLMQLMPGTWADMRVRLGLGSNPDEPRDNILAGTCYLRLMYDRFGHPGLFAAYHAGPGRYAEHLASGRALPDATLAYLSRVAGAAASMHREPAESPRDRLFLVHRAAPPLPVIEAGIIAQSALFVVKTDAP